jgi:hypothetical protein
VAAAAAAFCVCGGGGGGILRVHARAACLLELVQSVGWHCLYNSTHTHIKATLAVSPPSLPSLPPHLSTAQQHRVLTNFRHTSFPVSATDRCSSRHSLNVTITRHCRRRVRRHLRCSHHHPPRRHQGAAIPCVFPLTHSHTNAFRRFACSRSLSPPRPLLCLPRGHLRAGGGLAAPI